jgi:hypothetical protein
MNLIADNYRAAANVVSNCSIGGCTVVGRPNYQPFATYNNGSCLPLPCTVTCAAAGANASSNCVSLCTARNGYAVVGCANPAADNYRNVAAINDGSCLVGGCTDSTVSSYNPSANFDDGSCVLAGGRRLAATREADGRQLQVSQVRRGCRSPTAINYDATTQLHLAGTCSYSVPGCTDSTDSAYTPDSTDNSRCAVSGCMDPSASNYNPSASRGTLCTYAILGCTHPLAENYPGDVTLDDGSCIFRSAGCTSNHPPTVNFNPQATVDDGSCIFVITGCTSNTSINLSPDANTDDGSCVAAVGGCMAPGAFNYNPVANRDDGSCYMLSPRPPPPLSSIDALNCSCELAVNYYFGEAA